MKHTKEALSGELSCDENRSTGWITWKLRTSELEQIGIKLCWLPAGFRGNWHALEILEGMVVVASSSARQPELTIIDFAPMLKSLRELGFRDM
jgi:hypothetical protein